MSRLRAVGSILTRSSFRSTPKTFCLSAAEPLTALKRSLSSCLDKKTIGFGAEIESKKKKDMSALLREIQPHDLLKFGIIPELVGRLPVITALQSLNQEQLVRILTEPKNALVKQYKKLLEYDNVDLEFQPEALTAAAEKAIARGIGARGLRAVLEEVMTQVMYDVPSDASIARVVITPECVTERAHPEITRDSDRPARPRLGGRVSAGRTRWTSDPEQRLLKQILSRKAGRGRSPALLFVKEVIPWLLSRIQL